MQIIQKKEPYIFRHHAAALMTGLLLIIAICINAHAVTTNLPTDPEKALFETIDVENFIRTFRLLPEEGEIVDVLKAEYFNRASPGLQQFIKKYNLTPERMAKAIRKHREKYAGIKNMPEWLAGQSNSIRKAYARLKERIPNAVFPPTYFLVADYRGIASGSEEGQLVSVEKFDITEKSLDTLVIHELVHFQQAMSVGVEKYMAIYGPEKSLLALTIREGTAEFFADLVTGRITQEEARPYVLKHEKRLWQQFLSEMHGKETGDWMWKKPKDPDQPPHIAYYLGSRIVEAYYNRAEDKTKAVREILSVTDYKAFLKKSGYAELVQSKGGNK
jgi:hypothetical protein